MFHSLFHPHPLTQLVTLTVDVPPRPALTNTSMWYIQYFYDLTMEHWSHHRYFADNTLHNLVPSLFNTCFWRPSFICIAVCVSLIFFSIKCIFWCTVLTVLLLCWFTVYLYHTWNARMVWSRRFNLTVHPVFDLSWIRIFIFKVYDLIFLFQFYNLVIFNFM